MAAQATQAGKRQEPCPAGNEEVVRPAELMIHGLRPLGLIGEIEELNDPPIHQYRRRVTLALRAKRLTWSKICDPHLARQQQRLPRYQTVILANLVEVEGDERIGMHAETSLGRLVGKIAIIVCVEN